MQRDGSTGCNRLGMKSEDVTYKNGGLGLGSHVRTGNRDSYLIFFDTLYYHLFFLHK